MIKSWDKRGRTLPKDKRNRGIAKLKNWRVAVFERDNYTCQNCNIRGGNLEAHHKKQWAKYPDLRYKIDNGVTLCYECHKLIDKYRH